MSKYWVSPESVGFSVVKDVLCAVGGWTYEVVVSGIEDGNKALKIAQALNDAYSEGLNDR